MLGENLARVKEKIRQASVRCGRDPGEIRLVCVSKGVGVEKIREIVGLGVKDLGENRVHAALTKYREIEGEISWHMVGHLQTNKVKRAVKIFDLIHSLDSPRLAHKIEEEAARIEKRVSVLVQVNTSGESSKFGVRPEEAVKLVREAGELPHLRVCGLMTMAPGGEDAEASRPCFRALRELRDEIAGKKIENVRMEYLSMGMSQDFEVAVEEGADLLRIGSAIFRG